MNLKFLYIVLLFLLFVQNSYADSLLIPKVDPVKQRFFQFINEGYIRKYRGEKVIPKFPSNALTCIYGVSINHVSKNTVSQFYRLLGEELHLLQLPKYTNNREKCSDKSSIYVYIHDQNVTHKNLKREFSKAFLSHGINTRFKSHLNPLAFSGTRIRKNNMVGFASVDQMTKYLAGRMIYSNHLKGWILEEIFQVVTFGRDIKVKGLPMSQLHEPDIIISSLEEINFKAFREYQKTNPVGLCEYDLWHLLMLSTYKESVISYKSYIRKFINNFDLIKKQALFLENNPIYKDLFDSRCIGKNTGINTKIGIE